MAQAHDPRAEPISEAEFLASLRVAGEEAILVGGQALAFWLAYFNLPLPRGPGPVLSHDADFLGMHQHVGLFARALQGKAEYPTDHQISALHGAVVKQTPKGPRILVDVLRSVVGIDADGVRMRAIAARHPTDETVRFLVMNPVDCLISRFENLRQLPDKRTEVGFWQARIGIMVCRAYLQRLLKDGDERSAIRAATRVLQLAGTAPGLQAYRLYDLEPLAAIPVEDFATESFRTKQYAKVAARIDKLRNGYQAPHARAPKP